MAIALDAIAHSLAEFTTGHEIDQRFWLSFVHMLQVSFSADDVGMSGLGYITQASNLDLGFWNSKNLAPILPNLCKQVLVCATRQMPQGCQFAIQACLQSLLRLINDDAVIKTMNLEVSTPRLL